LIHTATRIDGLWAWQPHQSVSGSYWADVASADDGNLVMAADSNGQIHVSATGGQDWKQFGPTRTWRGLACSANCRRMVAVVIEGHIYTSATETLPGTAGAISGGSGDGIVLIHRGNGLFEEVSHTGEVTVH
jgi:hypothetical protein